MSVQMDGSGAGVKLSIRSSPDPATEKPPTAAALKKNGAASTLNALELPGARTSSADDRLIPKRLLMEFGQGWPDRPPYQVRDHGGSGRVWVYAICLVQLGLSGNAFQQEGNQG